ncbi:hypothetical protein Tco_1154766 [Tanacetum coccineum]
MTAENKLYFQLKGSYFLIVLVLEYEFNSTIDASNTAKEMWTAIERHKQGESLSTRCQGPIIMEFGKKINLLLERREPWSLIYSCQGVLESKDALKVVGLGKSRQSVGKQNGIQCFNCKGLDTMQGRQEAKRVKEIRVSPRRRCDVQQAEQGVPLQAEQADWLEDTDEEIDEQELEAHYSYMAKIQEVSPEESSFTGQPLEQVQNHDENDVFANVRRHSEQPESINCNTLKFEYAAEC